jgi:hypothetical protein
MTVSEGSASAALVEPPAQRQSGDPRRLQPQVPWEHPGEPRAARLRLLQQGVERDDVPLSAGGDTGPTASQPDAKRASLTTVAGAMAVLIYMILIAPPLLAASDGGNPFILILGAIVLFFLTEMVVNGLADVAVWLARRLEPLRARDSHDDGESPPV